MIEKKDCDEELLNASRFIKSAEYPDSNEVLTVGDQREWMSLYNRSLSVLEKKYSDIVDDFAAKKGIYVSIKMALTVKRKIGGHFVKARLIEANRREIGANSGRNEDFLRNFILNEEYISKFNNFIFNCDRTGLQIGEKIKTGTVLAWDSKRVATSFKEPAGRLTLLYTIGANGTLLDPYVLLKGDRNQEITDKIISDIFKHWIIGRNERSFITSEHFLRYLKEVFHPQTKLMLEAQNLSFKDQPRLLIMDGHSSHISTDAQVFADRMNIEFLFLPSHSSALLQPLDIVGNK